MKKVFIRGFAICNTYILKFYFSDSTLFNFLESWLATDIFRSSSRQNTTVCFARIKSTWILNYIILPSDFRIVIHEKILIWTNNRYTASFNYTSLHLTGSWVSYGIETMDSNYWNEIRITRCFLVLFLKNYIHNDAN